MGLNGGSVAMDSEVAGHDREISNAGRQKLNFSKRDNSNQFF
jgi:hypothetical protein